MHDARTGTVPRAEIQKFINSVKASVARTSALSDAFDDMAVLA